MTAVITRAPAALIVQLALIILAWAPARAQQTDGFKLGAFRVETELCAGPLYSNFLKHPYAPGESDNALGMITFARVLWHPDHLLGVGLLSGYILFVSDSHWRVDSNSSTEVSGRLTAIPLMIDVSMQKGHFDVGAGLGGYILSTVLTDSATSRSSKFELGILAHASYHMPIGGGWYLGPELVINFLSYRGIASVAPQLELKYDLIAY